MRLPLLYLLLVVAANLGVAALGAGATVWIALLCIGPDLTVRDVLHEEWGQQARVRMVLLLAAATGLTWACSRSAGRIGLASTAAFALAGAGDTLAYELLRPLRWRIRVNFSNVAGAAIDSLVFPYLAFGAWLPSVVLGQFAAKVAGGLVWSALLPQPRRFR